MRHIIQSPQAPQPKTAYSQAIVATGTRFLFISGQVPVDKEGHLVGAGDFRAQAHQVFRNMQNAAGSSRSLVGQCCEIDGVLNRYGSFPHI